jgi:hypothetical protein
MVSNAYEKRSLYKKKLHEIIHFSYSLSKINVHRTMYNN